jgi:hypothetical protein
VETLREGDEVASRPENDVYGTIAFRPIEEVFVRTGRVLHLHLSDGQLIRTTPEHPFWVEELGWTPADMLRAGMRLATLGGEWVSVEEAFDTGEYETVYNCRVAEHHTYFVGDDTHVLAVWAHNVYVRVNQEGSTFALKVDKSLRYISANKTIQVQERAQAWIFSSAVDAQKQADWMNQLSSAFLTALKTHNNDFSVRAADGLLKKHGKGYLFDFSSVDANTESLQRNDTDGLFFALISAPKNGDDHRPPLDWTQASAVFTAVNARLRAEIPGFVDWKIPVQVSNAAIEAWHPRDKNPAHGIALPAPQDDPAYGVDSAGNPTYLPHKIAADYERLMAYQIHSGGVQGMPSTDAEIVVWWGARIGGNGSDAISVHPISGRVTLWDSKAYAADKTIESETFTVESNRLAAVEQAQRLIENLPSTLLDPELKGSALDSLDSGEYRMVTLRYLTSGPSLNPKDYRPTTPPPAN